MSDKEVKIDGVKAEIVALFKVGAIIKGTLEDGKLNVLDLPALMQVAPHITNAATNLNAAREEIKSLNTEEIKQLALFVGGQVGGIVTSEDLLAKVSAGIEMVESIYKFAILFKK